MVITVLQGHVKAENWSAFQIDYQSRILELPVQMVQTYLLQNTSDPTLWQIISVWKSREALDEMRSSGETPAGVLMFRNVGVEPELSIFRVPLSAP